jgi:hypothetical protein
MGRANVYLPDDLERRVKAAQIPISEVCQRALLAAVEAAEGAGHPFGEEVGAQFRRGWQAGVRWTEQASVEQLLTLLRDQRLAEIPAEMLAQDLYSLTQEEVVAWEAGFQQAARATVRMPEAVGGSPVSTPPGESASVEDKVSSQQAGTVDLTKDTGAGSSVQAEPAPEGPSSDELGDDSGCQIGVTLEGNRVSFDPHAAVRAGKSPLFAILGQAELRARLVLSVAQDAASRGTGVVLLDLSGQLASRAAGLGRNVRVVRRSMPAMPGLDDLVQGAVGLGGLWDTVAGLSRGSGLGQLLGGFNERLEPGYVTVIGLSGEGQLGAIVPAMQILSQFASKTDFPRMLHVDLPAGMTIPAIFSSRLGRIVRTAREQNAAIGLSAENADTLSQIAGGGALLSTAVAFATSNPVEADRLRNLLGLDAPILLNPPGTPMLPGDDTWAVMRDLHGRLGQLRMKGW